MPRSAGAIAASSIGVSPSAEHAVRIEAAVNGVNVRSASGQTLTAPRVDSINTFDAPDAVVPRQLATAVNAGRIVVELPAKSVSVIGLQP